MKEALVWGNCSRQVFFLPVTGELKALAYCVALKKESAWLRPMGMPLSMISVVRSSCDHTKVCAIRKASLRLSTHPSYPLQQDRGGVLEADLDLLDKVLVEGDFPVPRVEVLAQDVLVKLEVISNCY